VGLEPEVVGEQQRDLPQDRGELSQRGVRVVLGERRQRPPQARGHRHDDPVAAGVGVVGGLDRAVDDAGGVQQDTDEPVELGGHTE
jgi:hypothetical protein